MARYNTFKYNSGKVYGELVASKYSVAPFIAYAQDYDEVILTWRQPQFEEGNSAKTFKLIRNQYAYSETQDDGTVLVESSGALPSPNAIDRTDVGTSPLAAGRFAFYSIWIQLESDDSWVLAGTAEVLVPRKHSTRIYPRFNSEDNSVVPINFLLQTTHERFLSFIPKVFVSDAVTDTADGSSDLSLFLEGFSFTVDEFLTSAELVLPGLSGKYSNTSIVGLQSRQLGVSEDPQGLTKNQKYLVRDAVYIYSKKGTLVGLTRFVKNITGYVPTITVKPNLMLSLQNSTFYKGIGGWKTGAGTVLSALNTSDVPTAGPNDLVVDNSWVAKVDTAASASPYPEIYLGADNPISEAIPVTAGVDYELSFWVKRNGTSGSIYGQSIKWYDQHGNRIFDTPDQGTDTVTTSWVRKTFYLTAPAGAVFASIGINFTKNPIYYVDRVQFWPVLETPPSYYYEARAVHIYLNPGDNFEQTRLLKVPRLSFEIKKYLPVNTPYFIYSPEGFESSGISS